MRKFPSSIPSVILVAVPNDDFIEIEWRMYASVNKAIIGLDDGLAPVWLGWLSGLLSAEIFISTGLSRCHPWPLKTAIFCGQGLRRLPW